MYKQIHMDERARAGRRAGGSPEVEAVDTYPEGVSRIVIIGVYVNAFMMR